MTLFIMQVFYVTSSPLRMSVIDVGHLFQKPQVDQIWETVIYHETARLLYVISWSELIMLRYGGVCSAQEEWGCDRSGGKVGTELRCC
jgi:hypothetical protein